MNSKFGISRLRSAVGIGAASLIVLAGVALVGVGVASAAPALSFTSPPSSVVANATTTFTVAYTGATTGDTITLSSTNCTLSPSGNLTPTTSGASGNVTYSNIVLSAASTGSCALSAADTTTTGGTAATATVTVTPAAANKLVFTTPPPATAGAGVPLTLFKVSSEDQYGNLMTGSTDTIAIASSCTLAGTTSVAEVGGVASFSAVAVNQVGSCILIASDSTTSVTAASSSAIAVSGGTPAKLAFTVPPPASVLTTGTAITAFKVAVEDASGNIDLANAGSTDSITVSSPCLAASVVGTAVAGVATFTTAEFSTVGSCILTATDTTHTVTPATATSVVGTAQPVLSITTKSAYLDSPLTLATTGGAGTGAVTYSVANGTATLCAVSTAGVLTAKTGGTCLVTAYKAAITPYAPATSAVTTVTISSAPKAVRLVGAVWNARKTTITVTGYNFIGRPKITSNVAGFSAVVSSDSGKSLRIVVTVKGSASKPGVKVMTIKLANGKTTSVRYSLH